MYQFLLINQNNFFIFNLLKQNNNSKNQNLYFMKSIDINAREWFDKINGNSYFSAQIVINYGMDSQRTYFLPFQYGYGEHYIHQAFNLLLDNLEIDPEYKNFTQFKDVTGTIIRNNKIKTLKRELKEENY